MDVSNYLKNVTLVSDQVDKKELAVILRELNRIVASDRRGDVVEFGCYEGTTSVHLARLLQGSGRELYLYDSFQGLPEKTALDTSPAGTQFKAGALTASRKTLIRHLKHAAVPMPNIKKAWFSSLTSDDIPESIAFAFLDGDFYESIRDPLLLIQKNLMPGATVIVDDYVNEALPGAATAVDEWVAGNGLSIITEASLAIIRLPE